ncbi:MAG TPA: hypothetical protein VEZ11_09890 [Thermoanaerobaculia bacterium]|nr:hypothetical protein [Thermoanaerobaculia bacterium]
MPQIKSISRLALTVYLPAIAGMMIIPPAVTAIACQNVEGLTSIYIPILLAELFSLTAGYAVGLIASRTPSMPSKLSTLFSAFLAIALLLVISAFTQATRVGRQMFYHSAFSNWIGREVIIVAICIAIGLLVGLAAGGRSKLRVSLVHA